MTNTALNRRTGAMKVIIEDQEWYPVTTYDKDIRWCPSLAVEVPDDVLARYDQAKKAFSDMELELDKFRKK